MKIAVIGSINKDMVLEIGRIPLKGETIKCNKVTYFSGGKGANQAVAMAKLGAEVEMFGCVGDDFNGTEMIQNLKNFNIKTENIKILENVPTGLAIISVGENDNTIIVVAGANEKVDIAYFDSIKDKVKNYDLVVLQCEIPLETVSYVIDYCYENKIKVVLNPAPALNLPQNIIDKVNYMIPNENEAKIIFNENEVENIIKKYPEKVIISMGEKGILTSLKNGDILKIPARKTNVVDTTGAGDTLNGAFSFQIAKGKNIKEALEYANICASLSIEKFGAQSGMPTRNEVEKIFKK